MKKDINDKKHHCVHQVNIGGYYYCQLVIDRQKNINEKNDDVKYGGVIVHLDDRCFKRKNCGFEKLENKKRGD